MREQIDPSKLELITKNTRFEVGDFLHLHKNEHYLVPAYGICKVDVDGSVYLKGFSSTPYSISYLAACGFYRYVNHKYIEYDPSQQKDRDDDL